MFKKLAISRLSDLVCRLQICKLQIGEFRSLQPRRIALRGAGFFIDTLPTIPIPMTTFRVFAARRARAGFHPWRWRVIGSIIMAGSNAAGRSSPAAMRQSATSTNTVRWAALPARRRYARAAAAWR